MDEMLASVERVSADHVLKLAEQFFDHRRMGVAALGRLNGFRIRRSDLA
jgi:hypothetical protein